MGITERKEREKEQRRNAIIDAAERVFFSKGVAAATMDDVAEAAELSKGTLYLYFKSKEELYFAITKRGLHILGDMFLKTVQNTATGIDKVFAIGQAYIQFWKEYPDYFNALLYYEAQEIKMSVKETELGDCVDIGFQSLQILIQALQEGIEDGSIRSDIDPDKMAMILWGQSSGVIQLVALKGDHLQSIHGIDMEGILEYALQNMRNTLAP